MRVLAFTTGILIATLFAGPTAAQDVLQQIKDNCSREWGLDYRMIEHCQMRQIEAGREFVTIQEGEAAEGTRRMLLANCYNEWSSRSKTDWRMIVHCYRRQTEAMERLQRD